MSVVILDDRDANVTRNGQWQNAGVQQEFLQTTTSSGTQGSTLTVHFWGTGIAVHATLGFGAQATMSFTVDSGTATSVTAPQAGANPQFHQTVFSQSRLTDGEHTLVITQDTTINPTGSTNFFIDYFVVNTGSNADLLGQTTFYDDTDPAIQYEGSWGSTSGTDQDLQSTLHSAGEVGDTATLNFDGTGITVFGNIKQNTTGEIATFSVDKASPFAYAVAVPAPGSVLGVAANQQFFQASGLSPGNHTLVMTAPTAGVFFLDYVTTTGFITPAVSSSSSGSHTGSSSAPSAGNTGTADPSTNATTAKSSSDVGAIAGGVVGGLVALAALVLFFVWYRRRQREEDLEIYGSHAPANLGGGPKSDFQSQQNMMTQNSTLGSSLTTPYIAQSGASGYAPNQYAPNSSYSASVYTAGAAGLGAGQGSGAGGMHPNYAPAPVSSESQANAVSPTGTQLSNPYSGMYSPPASNSHMPNPYDGVAAGAVAVDSMGRSRSRSTVNQNRQLPPTPGASGSGGLHARHPSGSTDYSQSTGANTSGSVSGRDAVASAGGSVVEMKRRLEWANPAPVVHHQDSGLRGVPVPEQRTAELEEVPPEYTAA